MATVKEIKSYLFHKIKPLSADLGYKRDDEPQGGGIKIMGVSKGFSYGFFVRGQLSYNEVGGFFAFIFFPEVTSIVNPILVRNKLIGGKETDHSSFFRSRLLNVQVDCYTMDDLYPFAEQYVKCFTEMALPYFEEWGKLTKLYDIIKDMNEDELFEKRGIHYEYITPAILCLCNDPRYEEFIERVYEKYKKIYEKYKEDEDEQVYLRNYNASKELREALKHVKPVYNI